MTSPALPSLLPRTAAAILFGLLPGCDRGSPPGITDPGNQVAIVGRKLTVDLFATDPDGDALTFGFRAASVADLDAHAGVALAPDGHGVFTYSPVGGHEGDHIFDFLVNDGTYETSLSISIEVRGAAGSESAPRFRQPSAGVVLDLEVQDCTEFEVLVEDPDTPEIVLSLADPPLLGADLSASPDGLQGSVTWCPDNEQRQQRDANVVLSADDRDNPPTLHPVPIAIRPSSGAGCPGNPPVITHDAKDWATTGDLELTAEITDDQGLGGEPYVFYAYDDPTSNGEVAFEALTPAKMTHRSGDRWAVVVPNPLASAGGEEAELYYAIQAVDDDDADGGCDHRTDSPAQGVHHVTISRSGATDDPPTCEDDAAEDVGPGDDTQQDAMQFSPLSETSTLEARACPQDDDWYWVRLDSAAELTLTLDGEMSTDADIDLELHSNAELLQASALPTSQEIIVSDCLAPGDYFARAFVFSPSDPGGAYTLGLQFAPCGGATCCESSPSPGCGDAAIEACVCELDEMCCSEQWDDQCVDNVAGLGCGSC